MGRQVTHPAQMELDISYEAEREGYKITSPKYWCKGANTKFSYICPLGHEATSNHTHWYNGKRCKRCSQRLPQEAWVSRFKEQGLILQDNVDTNNKQVRFTCLQGHQGLILPRDVYQDRGCPQCTHLARSGSYNLTNCLRTPTKPVFLYSYNFLFSGLTFTKVGLTCSSSPHRMTQAMSNLGTLPLNIQKELLTYEEAFYLEQAILFTKAPTDLPNFGGYTECFEGEYTLDQLIEGTNNDT